MSRRDHRPAALRTINLALALTHVRFMRAHPALPYFDKCIVPSQDTDLIPGTGILGKLLDALKETPMLQTSLTPQALGPATIQSDIRQSKAARVAIIGAGNSARALAAYLSAQGTQSFSGRAHSGKDPDNCQ